MKKKKIENENNFLKNKTKKAFSRRPRFVFYQGLSSKKIAKLSNFKNSYTAQHSAILASQ